MKCQSFKDHARLHKHECTRPRGFTPGLILGSVHSDCSKVRCICSILSLVFQWTHGTATFDCVLHVLFFLTGLMIFILIKLNEGEQINTPGSVWIHVLIDHGTQTVQSSLRHSKGGSMLFEEGHRHSSTGRWWDCTFE